MPVRLEANGRRAHVFGAFEAGPGDMILYRQVEVLRAGLPEYVETSVASHRELGDGLLRRHVNHVEGGAGELGEGDGAMHRLRLGRRWPGDRVVLGVGLATLDRLLPQHIDGDAVLGVHHDRRAVLGRLLHRPEDLAVVRVEDAGVGHEQLEAGDPLVDDRLHLLEGRVVDVADDHVEAVVDGAVARGFLHPVLEAAPNRLPLDLDREVDHRGRASVSGGARPGLEVVGDVGTTERQLKMGVDVDSAGDDVFPRGVDHRVGALLPMVRAGGRNCHDLLVLHQDVCRDRLGGGDDRSVGDDGSHPSPPLSPRRVVWTAAGPGVRGSVIT